MAIRIGMDHPNDRRVGETVRRQPRVRGGDGAGCGGELPEVGEVRTDVFGE